MENRIRPGITIQHARDLAPESSVVSCDIVGFIGLVPPRRWPEGVRKGDCLELKVGAWGDLARHPAVAAIDPVTIRAVQAFFLNGGRKCFVFGLCVDSTSDLVVSNPAEAVFEGLLDRLVAEEDIGLLVMPALAYLPIQFTPQGRAVVPGEPVLHMLLAHCQLMNNRFLIVDPPRDLHDDLLIDWVSRFRDNAGPSASFGAIYYPWLMNGDELSPPSGSIAGLYARVENEHAPFGVHWPPANEILKGTTHPAVPIRWRDSARLNDAHINPILTQPSRGVVVWGARTLSRDSRWLHINSRRIASLVAEQLRRDSEWVVFEHQRPALWEIVERTVRSRLDQLWSAGLLTGDKPGLEYSVQCDAEMNPIEVRDAGQIHVKVLVRPIHTAEFVVIELRLGD